MFSVVSDCLQRMFHVTFTYDALDFSVQVPLGPIHGTSFGQGPPASDNWYPSLETFSNLFTLGPTPHSTPSVLKSGSY